MKFLGGLFLTMALFCLSVADTKYTLPKDYKTDTGDKEYTNKILHDLYTYIILENAKTALDDAKELKSIIIKKDLQKAKEYFGYLVSDWKRVQAFYILGELDDEYLDTPRYIDIFHEGNEDITTQLDLILSSKDNIEELIYKNSHKSMSALEYLLFTKDLKDERVNKALSIAIEAIAMHLEDIYNGYKQNEQSFYSDDRKANALIINALIESSYKLKEWRVAEIAGLTKKYKGNPDITRSEYFLSKNSKNAIISILLTYKDVMDSSKFEDFGDYFRSIVKTEELDKAIEAINKSIALAKEIKNDDITNTKKLYKSLKKVHVAFYIYLIDALKMNAKILDADGD